MTERIEIQVPVSARSSIGEAVKTWATAARVWAEVQTLRGQEFIAAQQAQYRAEYKVRIRYRPGISNEQRIIWRGKTLAITAVMDGGPRRGYIEMLASTGVADAV